MTTIGEFLKHGTGEIGRHDTMLLLCHMTKKNSAYVMLHDNELLPNSAEFLHYVNRRKQGEPLQYLLGKWDFMGRTLITDCRALIPRPETELLVEEALMFLQTVTKNRPKVLDLCTGSGCIAAAVAMSGEYDITAVDISSHALDLARENCAVLGVKLIQSDLFSKVEGKFDLIISNPPYITTNEMSELAPTVRDYEPHLALHGGKDGMDIYRRLIPECLEFLEPGGALYLEIGPSAVKGLMEEAGFSNVQMKQDYAGLDRIIYGKWR